MTLYRIIALCLALSLLPVRPAMAGVLDDIASPVTTPPGRTTLIVGTSLTLILLTAAKGANKQILNQAAEDRPLKKWAKVGYWWGKAGPNAIYTGLMLGAAAFGDENGFPRAYQMFFATLYSGLFSNGLKEIIHEPRPNEGKDLKSFPSGHATIAFAFASVVGAEHPWYFGVPAYAMGVLTAYSRVNDNRHHPHDVVFGATVGMAYGLGIHYLKRRNTTVADSRGWNFDLLPLDDLSGGMLKLSARF